MRKLERVTGIHYSLTYYLDNATKTSSRDHGAVYTLTHLGTIIMISCGLLSTIPPSLVIDVAVPAQNLPLEFNGVLVPELCSLPVQR